MNDFEKGAEDAACKILNMMHDDLMFRLKYLGSKESNYRSQFLQEYIDRIKKMYDIRDKNGA